MSDRSSPPISVVAAVVAATTLLLVGGCGGWRVVLEPTVPPDAITERTVIDESAGDLSAPKVAMIHVTGLIADAPGGLLGNGPNPVAKLARELDRAAGDGRVRAVVLRVSSRGGTVTGSDMVHREVMRFRERTGKPVVVVLGEVAASGGYYLACAGDEIVAHPTTITGSIGVIMQTVQAGAALERLGIEAEAITSGPNKAMGAPLGRPDPEHRALMQSMVDEFAARFVDVVRTARPGIDAGDLAEVTDGRVVTGRRAFELGLVDRLGDERDAFDRARVLAGIERARLVRYVRPGSRDRDLYSDGRARAEAASGDGGVEINLLRVDGLDAALLPGARFLYVWSIPSTGG